MACEGESTPDEDTVKIVEMTIKDFKQYINSVDTAAAGFEWIDFNFKEVLLWVKCYQTGMLHREIICERVNQCGKLHCCLILRNCCSHPNF